MNRIALPRPPLLSVLLLGLLLIALLSGISTQASDADPFATLQAVLGSFTAELDSRSKRWQLLEPDNSSISVQV
jgi:hypothetical protein